MAGQRSLDGVLMQFSYFNRSLDVSGNNPELIARRAGTIRELANKTAVKYSYFDHLKV